MTMQERIAAGFEELLNEGQQVLNACGWDGMDFQRHPPVDAYRSFRARSANIIRRVCRETSEHYREFERTAKQQYADSPSQFPAFLGVLRGAYRDYQGGLLIDLRSLIAAELLGDFLDQAKYLLSEGYHVPAASLAGAVLEDTLRKLCDRHGISYPLKTSINVLNVELAKAQVYNALAQKQITAYADIRNNADHGRSGEFKTADVEEMVSWVSRFATDYLR